MSKKQIKIESVLADILQDVRAGVKSGSKLIQKETPVLLKEAIASSRVINAFEISVGGIFAKIGVASINALFNLSHVMSGLQCVLLMGASVIGFVGAIVAMYSSINLAQSIVAPKLYALEYINERLRKEIWLNYIKYNL